MVKDSFGIKGEKIHYILRDKNGNIKEENTIISKTPGKSMNTITQLHDVLVADRLAGGTDALIDYGHAGTGSGQTDGDTNLAAPFTENRTQLTSKTQQTGADDNDVKYTYTLGAGVCTGNIEEIGLFITQTYTDANMHLYNDAISTTKGAGDTLTIEWTATYGAS
jgi:hypothetical protein